MVSRNNKSNKSSVYLLESHIFVDLFLFFFPTPPPHPHLGILVCIYMLLQETREKRTQQLLMYCLLPHLQLLTSNEILVNVACISKHRIYGNQLYNYSSIKSLTNSPSMQVIPPDVHLTQWSVRGSHLSCCSYKTPLFQHATAIHFYFVSGLYCSAGINRDLFSFQIFS